MPPWVYLRVVYTGFNLSGWYIPALTSQGGYPLPRVYLRVVDLSLGYTSGWCISCYTSGWCTSCYTSGWWGTPFIPQGGGCTPFIPQGGYTSRFILRVLVIPVHTSGCGYPRSYLRVVNSGVNSAQRGEEW